MVGGPQRTHPRVAVDDHPPVVVRDVSNSSAAAISLLKQSGAKEIRFLCLLAAPEGVARMCLDDAVQTRLNVVGAQASAGACQQTATSPNPGGGWLQPGAAADSMMDYGEWGRSLPNPGTGPLGPSFDFEMAFAKKTVAA